MSKKYKHINLPNRLITNSEQYEPNRGRAFETYPDIDFDKQGRTISKKLRKIKRKAQMRLESLRFEADKDRSEIVLSFKSKKGFLNRNLIEKYNIDIFYKKDKNTYYGKISNSRLPNQERSDFEQFQKDVDHYSKTNEGRSYFKNIKNIKPLSLDEIIDIELKEEYEERPQESISVDISFAEGGALTSEKIDVLKNEYGDRFLSALNTSFVHFCRINATYEDLENVVSSFAGISRIELTPRFLVAPSFVEHDLEDEIEIIPPDQDINPILILDTAVNDNHALLQNAVLSTDGTQTTDKTHATAVTSLVVCGQNIKPAGEIKQLNRAVVINILEPSSQLEARLENAVREHASTYPLVIVNFSINEYIGKNKPYISKPVSNLTKLIDELCWKYNCLFVTSAGNLQKGLSDAVQRLMFREAYPNFFNSAYSGILPPADSINSISVGSIAYQESPNSVAKIKQPTPDTRANLKDNHFVKPDFVHYDSNWEKTRDGYAPEFNGVFLAGTTNNNCLTKSAGTSFATPLVTHEIGILHNLYPSYTSNSIKALMIHTADSLESHSLASKKINRRLVGNGMPNLERAKFSLNTASTIVVEDSIPITHKKKIRFPIPSSIAGSARKRLMVKTTLVYNPPINSLDSRTYNPIDISTRLLRDDNRPVSRFSTRDKLSDAFSKSNVKQTVETFSTSKHTGTFWEVEVECKDLLDDLKNKLGLPEDYKQKYSLVITISDMTNDEELDLHTEISQMIDITVPVEIPVEAT